MDTDDLTRNAYQTLIMESGKTSKFLRAEIGAAASRYPDEKSYLGAIHAFVSHFAEQPEDYLERWNLSDEVDTEGLSKQLAALEDKILRVIKTPLSKRGPAF